MRKYFAVITIFLMLLTPYKAHAANDYGFWEIRSVDTMKYSRDLAREKLGDKSFDEVIDQQMKEISDAGANYVAINTPYDKEFIPFLKRWVNSAREHNLRVWFRGNFSGWEGWFEYSQISREQHIKMTEQFILDNKEIFADGDIFTPCPECENGLEGDPRETKDIQGFRNFLIDLKKVSVKSFVTIGKHVDSGYFSMNGDVAKLIMDKETTRSLGGIITIDHYVKTPEELAKDIKEYIEISGGKVVLGEFGVPIIDIHGNLDQQQQAYWIKKAMHLISEIDGVIGVNYWTNVGSSTSLWSSKGISKEGVSVLKAYYDPIILKLTIQNKINEPIKSANIKYGDAKYETDSNGVAYIVIPQLPENEIYPLNLNIEAEGYYLKDLSLGQLEVSKTIYLDKISESLWFKIKKVFRGLFGPK